MGKENTLGAGYLIRMDASILRATTTARGASTSDESSDPPASTKENHPMKKQTANMMRYFFRGAFLLALAVPRHSRNARCLCTAEQPNLES